MSVHIRKLEIEDLAQMEQMANEKLTMTDTTSVFEGQAGVNVLKYFVLPKNVYGYDKMSSFGYFVDDKLEAVMGLRNLDNEPAWVFSFIITSYNCKNSIGVIKSLMKSAIEYQEAAGYFQWYVVSKLDKFDVWQKLFKNAREKYHHYVYGRVPANTMPKWLSMLQLSGGKLFPYDINISMYMSKHHCTSDEHEAIDFNERDIDFI
jgi:hypothetical protein